MGSELHHTNFVAAILAHIVLGFIFFAGPKRDAASVVAFGISAVLVVLGVRQNRTPISEFHGDWGNIMDASVLGFLLYIPIIYGLYLAYRWFQKKQDIKAAAPDMSVIPAYDKGPMKVDISLQPVPARNIHFRAYGGDNWWRLHMNIRMSNEDWALFQKSGLIENTFFHYVDQIIADKPINRGFIGHHLKHMPNYKDFPSIQEAEAAKEELIRQLHNIRARLDDMKSSRSGGVDRERLEI